MDVRDKTVFSSYLFIHLLIIIRIVYALHEGLQFQLVSGTNQLKLQAFFSLVFRYFQ